MRVRAFPLPAIGSGIVVTRSSSSSKALFSISSPRRYYYIWDYTQQMRTARSFFFPFQSLARCQCVCAYQRKKIHLQEATNIAATNAARFITRLGSHSARDLTADRTHTAAQHFQLDIRKSVHYNSNKKGKGKEEVSPSFLTMLPLPLLLLPSPD